MSEIFAEPAGSREQEEGETLRPRFDKDGLVTAVVTDHATGQPLMVAHMNAEALDRTIETGAAHFWSRSRQKLWKKGETSGAIQIVHAIRVDCDQDALWVAVSPRKPEDTCHTGRTTCFYRALDLETRTLVHSDRDTSNG